VADQHEVASDIFVVRELFDWFSRLLELDTVHSTSEYVRCLIFTAFSAISHSFIASFDMPIGRSVGQNGCLVRHDSKAVGGRTAKSTRTKEIPVSLPLH